MSYVEAIGLIKNSPIKSQLLIKKSSFETNNQHMNQNQSIPCPYDLTPTTIKPLTTINNNQCTMVNQARKQLFNGSSNEEMSVNLNCPSDVLNYSNDGNTFNVTLIKNQRGLGLSIVGGVDCCTNCNIVSSSVQTPSFTQLMSSPQLMNPQPSAVDKLIRIKRVFPGDPASTAGLIPGDIILEANGTSTIGMTQVVSFF